MAQWAEVVIPYGFEVIEGRFSRKMQREVSHGGGIVSQELEIESPEKELADPGKMCPWGTQGSKGEVGPTSMTRTEILTDSRLLGGFVNEWKALSRDASASTPFQTFEWQSTWLTHYGAGKTPLGLAVYEGQDLVGLSTFVISRGLWKTLRWIGGGPSDYLQPMSRTGYEDRVGEETASYLETVRNVNLIDLHQVRENQPIASHFPVESKLGQATSLVLDLPHTFDEYLQQIGKSLRYDVRKLNKELFKSGKATMDTAAPENVSQSFEIFLQQHQARWRERKLPGAFLGKSLRFHRQWIHLAAQNGLLRLKILRVDGVPAGAIYAMNHNRTVYYYQAGFDPLFKSISPGTLLVASCIREGIEEGMGRLDFMRGDEPYKRRWKPQNVYHNVRIIQAVTSPRGKVGLSWNLKAHSLELKIRSRLEGGGPT